METGRQPAPTRSLAVGATYALTGRSTSRHQRRVACWRRRRGDRALPTSPSWAASCRRSIMRASASTPVSPGCWLCILPSVRCLPSGWTIGLRRRPPPQAATLDRQLRPPYLRRWLRHGSTMQRPRGRVLLRGMSLAQTPPRAPPSKAVAGRVRLSGAAGGDLPCKVRDAERRCPHERGVLGPRLGHMPSEPSGRQRYVVRTGHPCDPAGTRPGAEP